MPKRQRKPSTFNHPIIRLAMNDGEFALAYRRFNRVVRLSLDPDLPPQDRQQHARDVLRSLPELAMQENSSHEFLLEWLQCVTEDLDDIILLDARALEELRDECVIVGPVGWTGSTLMADQLPYLKRSDDRLAEPILSGAALELWQQAIAMTRSVVEQGQLATWGIEQCNAGLRALGICSVLGQPEPNSSGPERVLRFFEGEGTCLWDALSKRLTQIEGHTGRQTARSNLRTRILLHLRGMATTKSVHTAIGGLNSQSEAVAQCHSDLIEGSFSMRVITEAIPPATDRTDREVIKQFEPLRQSIPVARMPGLGQLSQSLATLRDEFPWAPDVIDRLEEMLVPPARLGVKELVVRPVLLAGPPGSGKSRLCRRLAEVLGWPYMAIACGGSGDIKQLSGTSRGWATGEPMPILRMMLMRNTASVFVLLDEVDKAAVTQSSSPPLMSLLLGLLEPETAARYRDGFLQVSCNLSRVTFWATANSLNGIPEALRSRFEIAHMPGPGRVHMPHLARSITTEIEREWKLPQGVLPQLPDDFWADKPVSARLAKRLVQKYIASWSKQALSPGRLH